MPRFSGVETFQEISFVPEPSPHGREGKNLSPATQPVS